MFQKQQPNIQYSGRRVCKKFDYGPGSNLSGRNCSSFVPKITTMCHVFVLGQYVKENNEAYGIVKKVFMSQSKEPKIFHIAHHVSIFSRPQLKRGCLC